MSGTVAVNMEWEGGETFAAEIGKHRLTVDSDAEAGPTPMQLLAAGVTGCMAIDINHILGRMRTPAASLHLHMDTERAPEPPRRFTTLRLTVRVTGDVPQANLDRAIQLSRDTYCSAFRSLREDIELTVDTEILPA